MQFETTELRLFLKRSHQQEQEQQEEELDA